MVLGMENLAKFSHGRTGAALAKNASSVKRPIATPIEIAPATTIRIGLGPRTA